MVNVIQLNKVNFVLVVKIVVGITKFMVRVIETCQEKVKVILSKQKGCCRG